MIQAPNAENLFGKLHLAFALNSQNTVDFPKNCPNVFLGKVLQDAIREK